jgi:hypothetical protein
MIQPRCQSSVNLPRTPRRTTCLFASLGFLGLLAERTPLGVSIIDATVIALGIDRIRPHQQPPPIHILPDHQSKHFLYHMFELEERRDGCKWRPACPVAVSSQSHGHGRPMILIPGYSCPGEIWDEIVAHYQDRYQTHVLTLAGFAGVPRVPSPFLERARSQTRTPPIRQLYRFLFMWPMFRGGRLTFRFGKSRFGRTNAKVLVGQSGELHRGFRSGNGRHADTARPGRI